MNCGIMVNYQCTAACAHCLYASSPAWSCGYMTPEKMHEACTTLRRHGGRSVHIGGGEPFIDFNALCKLAQTARECGISIEYVETNAFWAIDEKEVIRKLDAMQQVGIDALCISADAYHAEFVDPALPLRLSNICRRVGFGQFVWQTQINRLRFNGRAITLENAHHQKKPLPKILQEAAAKKSCRNLTSTGHFHIDLHGRYIPPGCTGFVLPLEEALTHSADALTRYKAFTASYTGGPLALYALAQNEGFIPDETGYPSVCNFCFHLRQFLSQQDGFDELDAMHYQQAVAV